VFFLLVAFLAVANFPLSPVFDKREVIQVIDQKRASRIRIRK
jgi:hypothetical protein